MSEAKAKRPGPSQEDRGNVARFDDLARKLDVTTSEDARTQRWFARVGRLLRHARSAKQVVQSEAARVAELTQPYVSRLENGITAGRGRGPTIDVLMRYAASIGCDVEITLRDRSTGRALGTARAADENALMDELLPVIGVPDGMMAMGAHEDPFGVRVATVTAGVRKGLRTTPLDEQLVPSGAGGGKKRDEL